MAFLLTKFDIALSIAKSTNFSHLSHLQFLEFYNKIVPVNQSCPEPRVNLLWKGIYENGWIKLTHRQIKYWFCQGSGTAQGFRDNFMEMLFTQGDDYQWGEETALVTASCFKRMSFMLNDDCKDTYNNVTEMAKCFREYQKMCANVGEDGEDDEDDDEDE